MGRKAKKEISPKDSKKDAPKKRGGTKKEVASKDVVSAVAEPKADTSKKERRKAPYVPNTSRTVVRQITDTVGLTLHMREGDTLPKDGGTVHVKTEKGEEFDLRISKVQQTRKGYCVWCWLRKGAKDGERWRNSRLQQATITW